MWVVHVGGVKPESRTDVVGEFQTLDDIRVYLKPLQRDDVKFLERICDDGNRVQWIIKRPETSGGAGVLAHLQAVVIEAKKHADNVYRPTD